MSSAALFRAVIGAKKDNKRLVMLSVIRYYNVTVSDNFIK
jgi:hypothetical protein